MEKGERSKGREEEDDDDELLLSTSDEEFIVCFFASGEVVLVFDDVCGRDAVKLVAGRIVEVEEGILLLLFVVVVIVPGLDVDEDI